MKKTSMRQEYTNIDGCYMHIDNGGIYISLHDREVDGEHDLVMIIESTYLGHPTVETIVPLNSDYENYPTSDFLIELGNMFIKNGKRMKLRLDKTKQ